MVIGGGIVGASAAYHLTRAGADVVVVDRADPGGATRAGAGIVFPWLTASSEPALVELMFAGAAAYPQLVADLAAAGDADVGYERVGGLVVGAEPAALDLAAATLERRRDEGAQAVGTVGRLGVGEPAAMFAPLDPSLGGVVASGAARVDGDAIRLAMRAAAVAAGASVVTGDGALRAPHGRVQGVEVAGEVIDADAVVVAAGAWSVALCLPLGVDLPVAPQRGQIVHLHVPGLDTDATPVIEPFGSSHYLLAFPGSRVVVGATRETGAGFDRRVTAAGLAEVLGRALDVAPGLADATVTETRVGFRPATPDGAPLIGFLEAWDNVVVATGLGPYGLTAGPLTGAVVADLVSGAPARIDVSAFAPLRRSES